MLVDYEKLHLEQPSMMFWESFTDAIREYRIKKVEDFSYPKVATIRDFKRYLKELENYRTGSDLPRGHVPSSAFWLTDGQHYLGSGDIRHYLNDSLLSFGGHIGYSIRPQAWQQGLGTIQLKLLLEEAKKMGIQTARITCFDENKASVRVMEKNGAVLIGKVNNIIRGNNRLTRIYEIPLYGEN